MSRISCDNFTQNTIYQFVAGWTLLGSDFTLIFIFYIFILRAMFKFKAEGAAVKTLSTCGSHFILILFLLATLLLLLLCLFLFLLEVKVLVSQLCPTLCDPMDYSQPGSSVHGICQAMMEWVAYSPIIIFLPLLIPAVT